MLNQGNDIVPIPGTRKPEHIVENLASANVLLTAEQLAQIDAIAPRGAAVGGTLIWIAPLPSVAPTAPTEARATSAATVEGATTAAANTRLSTTPNLGTITLEWSFTLLME